MIVALIDNGSLEAGAHRQLRTLAAELSRRSGVEVHAVSWKHSDRAPVAELEGVPGQVLVPFVRRQVAAGRRSFLFVPLFISAQGAIGSALRRDLEVLAREETGGFEFAFTPGLADAGVLPTILADRIREAEAGSGRSEMPVVLVDHGGPSAESARLRDLVATEVSRLLHRPVRPCSMEGAHPPLLGDVLAEPAFAGRDVVVAQLFLAPGRHAGPGGDIEEICLSSSAHCHRTTLVGTHPRVAEILADSIRTTLSLRPS
jgi:hypothetical protein